MTVAQGVCGVAEEQWRELRTKTGGGHAQDKTSGSRDAGR